MLTGPFALLDQRLGERDDRVAVWGTERAREFARATAQSLWAVRGTPIEAAFADRLDRIVELTSQLTLDSQPEVMAP